MLVNRNSIRNPESQRTSSGEVGVEVHALLDGSTSRGFIGVTSQKTEDVVAATVTALGDQTEIRGQGTTVGSTGGLLVLVGRRDVVGQLSGALLDLTLVVGLGVVLVLFGESLHLVDGVHNTDEGTPGHTGQGVAAGANFTVDHETTAETEWWERAQSLKSELGMTFNVGLLTPGGRKSSSSAHVPKGTE